MAPPVVNNPNLKKSEIFSSSLTLNEEAARTAQGTISTDPQSVEDMRMELSVTNSLFPSLLNTKPGELRSDFETAPLARKSQFGEVVTIRNSLGHVTLNERQLSAQLKLENLNLSYDEGFVEVNYQRATDAPLADKFEFIKAAGATYDSNNGRLQSGNIVVGGETIDLQAALSNDATGIKLGYKSPESANAYGVSLDLDRDQVKLIPDQVKLIAVEIREADRVFNFKFSPEGEIYQVHGMFKVSPDYSFGPGAKFSSKDLESAVSFKRTFPQNGSISVNLDCDMKDISNPGFGISANIDVRDMNFFRTKRPQQLNNQR